ncbi:hypothetical protein [Eubacterium limosum]|uniref:hypothetical protein n=1 Tax=Eubacterium limosum TaxID=1736 RepID=UPI0037159C9B
MKKPTVFGAFVDLIQCFVAACGITLLINFFGLTTEFLNVTEELSRNAIINEVRAIFFPLITIIILKNVYFWGIDRFLEEKLSDGDNMTPTGIGAIASEMDEVPCEADDKIADYNINISVIHEAGHAVMAYLKKLEHYSVYVAHTSAKITYVYKNFDLEDVKDQILITYAGAVAEELVLGEFHYGCIGSISDQESDFSQATELIKAYIVMNDCTKSKSLIDLELSDEIIKLSNEFYQEAREILSSNKDALDTIIEALNKQRQLTQEEVEKLLDKEKGAII